MASRRTVGDALDLFEHVSHRHDYARYGASAQHADNGNCLCEQFSVDEYNGQHSEKDAGTAARATIALSPECNSLHGSFLSAFTPMYGTG